MVVDWQKLANPFPKTSAMLKEWLSCNAPMSLIQLTMPSGIDIVPAPTNANLVKFYIPRHIQELINETDQNDFVGEGVLSIIALGKVFERASNGEVTLKEHAEVLEAIMLGLSAIETLERLQHRMLEARSEEADPYLQHDRQVAHDATNFCESIKGIAFTLRDEIAFHQQSMDR